ncbi:TPA: toxin-antitoxin system, antitoxin component [Staphylococcus delphini]|nr:toxin-antitoxin system, antitoxin component [Staphylococcus delphini]HEC2148777.1 toxin-antitoxin system, antitoxin component [Staphylococcus delphini]HEC2151580.1 toxin-antitoxin system, antitoxin component [Staphylococcus delphini]HEC2160745.1 toxin-antitoxin system, antitoxin component [Staphylococcus delphini]HEC2167350.1 toxin-antitoxin system, antitoxin component [Staphylococcus delphini]
MATITIRVSDDEKVFLKYMADFLGLSLSEVLKQYTFEDLEDIYDAKVGDEALKEYRETGQSALDIEDVMKQWDVK